MLSSAPEKDSFEQKTVYVYKKSKVLNNLLFKISKTATIDKIINAIKKKDIPKIKRTQEFAKIQSSKKDNVIQKTKVFKEQYTPHPNMSNITQKWVNLLVPFTSGYNQKFTESELSRLSAVPQQSASRYLNGLVKKNLLNYTIQGRNKQFYLDLQKQTSYNLLQLIENHKALEFQQKSKEAAVIINELLNHAEAIILFGSHAEYKSGRDSDIDVIVVGKTEKDKIKAIKQRYHIQINEQYVSYGELAKSLKSKAPLSIELQKKHIFFGNISKTTHIFMEASL